MAERDTKRKAAGVAEAKAKSPSKKARKEKGDKTEKRDRKRSESGDSTDAPAKRSKEKDVADGAAREEGQGDDAKAEADGDTTEAPKYGEKNAVPQNHKEQKELKLKRKMLRNPHFEMVTQVCRLAPRCHSALVAQLITPASRAAAWQWQHTRTLLSQQPPCCSGPLRSC